MSRKSRFLAAQNDGLRSASYQAGDDLAVGLARGWFDPTLHQFLMDHSVYERAFIVDRHRHIRPVPVHKPPL